MEADRESRSRLIDCINRYLDESITAFQFDEEIEAISEATQDPAVRLIVSELWHCYDDCKDHIVVLSKEWWDYIQRLVLLLKSENMVVEERWRVWSWTQAVALAGMLSSVVSLILWGVGPHLLAIAVALGILAASLARRATHRLPTRDVIALMPFSRVADLLSVYRTCGFRKRRFPPVLGRRQIRSRWSNDLIAGWQCAVWVFFAPVVLCRQVLPHASRRLRVVMIDGDSLL